jgi:hypothetical protein
MAVLSNPGRTVTFSLLGPENVTCGDYRPRLSRLGFLRLRLLKDFEPTFDESIKRGLIESF